MECRFCLNTSVSKDIFDLKYVILKPFLHLLNIKKDDGLPQKICQRCILKISPMETFYKKSKEINVYLQIKHNIKIEKEKHSSFGEEKSLCDLIFESKEQTISKIKNNETVDYKSSVVSSVSKKEHVEFQKQFENSSIIDHKIMEHSDSKNNQTFDKIKDFSDSQNDCKFENEEIAYILENSFDLKSNVASRKCIKNKDIQSNHLILKQKRQPLKLFCPICSIKLSSITLYIKHLRTHKVTLSCKICAFPFISKEYLRIHLMKIHYCSYCQKYFKDKRPHERIEHNSWTPVFADEKIVQTKKVPEINLCPICGAIVRRNITKHMETHSGASFKCAICLKVFVTKFRLQQHTKIHYREQNFECDYCGSKFSSRHSLILHIKGVHLKAFETSCPICEKIFNGRGYLKEHIKRHMGDKRFTCNVCSNSFINARSLRDHVTKHSAERPFICNYCPKAFKTKEGCKRHEKIHNGVTPHKCPICLKEFIQRANMKSHFKYNHKGLDFVEEDAKFKAKLSMK